MKYFLLLVFVSFSALAGGVGVTLPPGPLRLGETPYPQVFLRFGQHWLLYTYPAGPFLVNRSVMVPVRPVAELLGAQVSWQSGSVTVFLGSRSVRYIPGRSEGEVNGSHERWRVAPLVLPLYNTAFVPLEPMLRVFGLKGQLAKTKGQAYVLRLQGVSLSKVDELIRSQLYWWDIGFIVNTLASSDVENLTPTLFRLNPLRPLPPAPQWARHPVAQEPLYARPQVTFQEAAGQRLDRGTWGIYVAEGSGSNADYIGLTPTALSGGQTTQHPCVASGINVQPYARIVCRLRAWRYIGTASEQPVQRVILRVIHYK